MHKPIQISAALADVKYEIRGHLSARASELERQGYEIVSLNIGNPGLFGYRTPETMRLAMIENLGQAEPYSHHQRIFPAREAVGRQGSALSLCTSFNTPYANYFRIATLPDPDVLHDVFHRIDEVLGQYA